MTAYLIIASRDPYEQSDPPPALALASKLVDAGNEVTLLLLENGVLGARRGPASSALGALAQRGVRVLADAFSLRERGIARDRLEQGVAQAEIDVVIDHLERGARALWH